MSSIPPPTVFYDDDGKLVPLSKAVIKLKDGKEQVARIVIKNEEPYDYTMDGLDITVDGKPVIMLDEVPRIIRGKVSPNPTEIDISFKFTVILDIDRKPDPLTITSINGAYLIPSR